MAQIIYRVPPRKERRAVVLRCPDLRFIGAHRGFIRRELIGLKHQNYYSLKHAGGAIALARAQLLPEEFRAVISEISLFLELSPEITHIVVINHEDCRKYTNALRAACCGGIEREDLVNAAEMLTRTFPSLQVGAYHAKFRNEDRKTIYFETLFETDRAKSLRKS